MITRTRFKKETKGNSEMAYYVVSCWLLFGRSIQQVRCSERCHCAIMRRISYALCTRGLVTFSLTSKALLRHKQLHHNYFTISFQKMHCHDTTLYSAIWKPKLLTMAEVCPKESIMSLITEKIMKRKTRKRCARREIPSLEEDESMTCLKMSRNSVQIEKECSILQESSSDTDKKSDMEIAIEETARELFDEKGEKSRLKRRKVSLDKDLVDSDVFSKKLKINSESKKRAEWSWLINSLKHLFTWTTWSSTWNPFVLAHK